jgi:hypothetical protein
MISKKQLYSMRICAQLLPDPAHKVVLELIEEIERLRELLEDRHYDFNNEEKED